MADTKTEKTVAEELREAAARLRRVSAGTTEGRWVCGQLEEQKDFSKQVAVSTEDALVAEINLGVRDSAWRYMRDRAVRDGQWIALTSPALAEPLASWLETTAARFDDEVDGHLHDTCDGAIGQDCYCFREVLAVARVLNGTVS